MAAEIKTYRTRGEAIAAAKESYGMLHPKPTIVRDNNTRRYTITDDAISLDLATRYGRFSPVGYVHDGRYISYTGK